MLGDVLEPAVHDEATRESRGAHPLLLCWDRTAGARHAIERAGELFPGRRAIVLHVFSPLAVMAAAGAGAVCDEETLRRGALEFAAEGVRIAAAAGLEATPEIVAMGFREIHRAILDAAAAHDAGVIVLGARTGTRPPFPPGSVSWCVAQHTQRPILLVPALAQASHGGAL